MEVFTRDDDRTIEHWRLEPRWQALELDDPPPSEVAPPLWKDLTLASITAALLWAAAVALFG